MTCNIEYVYPSDSGEYWCEGGEGQRSNTVNIIVTAGSVILESPVLPVMEGEAVTLHCRHKTTSSIRTADFYKDGVFIKTDSTGNMTIHNVSKCDEGLYKCNISGAGESPESRLAVRGQCTTEEGGDVIMESPVLPVTEGAAVTLRCRKNEISFDLKADFYKDGLLIRSNSTGEMTINSVSKSDEGLYKCSISGAGESAERWLSVKASRNEMNFSRHYLFHFLTVVKVLLALQLLVIGLLYWKKQRDTADAADNLSLCLNTNHRRKPQTEKDKDEPQPQDSLYSTI
ncbi:high affinity immunoglobulin gamma Fc receptor I-like [Thunnus albacares]|uniref:high affinity immunoglobulin gamma Fc receptor I-like n=1 Tax=Thunnus albacares TaxID=8236 RepID=UPI001CF62558|nr:high affinity immunoglobulin gamma Fc receptor I-like [Thunnus albacares]